MILFKPFITSEFILLNKIYLNLRNKSNIFIKYQFSFLAFCKVNHNLAFIELAIYEQLSYILKDQDISQKASSVSF